MTLPFPPRRAHLTAFWLGVNLPIVPLIMLLPIGSGWTRTLLAIALFVSALTVGSLWTTVPSHVYGLWNRTARVVALAGQRWVLAASYYLVICPAGLAGSRLELAQPSTSLWKPYGSGEPEGRDAPARRGWAKRLLNEARQPHQAWQISLLPFLVLLSWLQVDTGNDDVPSNIYTLY